MCAAVHDHDDAAAGCCSAVAPNGGWPIHRPHSIFKPASSFHVLAIVSPVSLVSFGQLRYSSISMLSSPTPISLRAVDACLPAVLLRLVTLTTSVLLLVPTVSSTDEARRPLASQLMPFPSAPSSSLFSSAFSHLSFLPSSFLHLAPSPCGFVVGSSACAVVIYRVSAEAFLHKPLIPIFFLSNFLLFSSLILSLPFPCLHRHITSTRTFIDRLPLSDEVVSATALFRKLRPPFRARKIFSGRLTTHPPKTTYPRPPFRLLFEAIAIIRSTPYGARQFISIPQIRSRRLFYCHCRDESIVPALSSCAALRESDRLAGVVIWRSFAIFR